MAPEAGTGLQYIQVMKCTATFPVSYTSQSTSFTNLAYLSGGQNNTVLSVNIQVYKGDQIGIMGTVTGICNSYSADAIHTSTINGLNVNLNRFGYQGSIESGAAPSYWGLGDSTSGQIGRIFMYYTVGQPTSIVSVMTIQPDTSSVPAGTNNKMIIGVKIKSTGTVANAKVTQFTFDTAGVFNFNNITGNAKVYYTGNTDTFNTLKLFDSTKSKPSSAFTITGNQVLDTGTVYFWLTFDVNFNATVNEYLDAKCTQVKWDSAGTTKTITPMTTSPPGKIRITPPLKKLNSISFTQPSTDLVYRNSVNNPVIRIDLNVVGTAGTLLLSQLKIATVNTNDTDITNVRLFYTSTTTFSTTYQLGTDKTISSGSVNFSSLNFNLPTGNSYLWVTYDISGLAGLFDTVDAKIPLNGITIGGKTYPDTEKNPAGERIIYTNFQYDAGISSFISPSYPFCKTNQIIKVRLRNYGITTLTSDTIRWTINGVMQTPYIWTGSLTTGNYVDITLGSYTFTVGNNYKIQAYTSYFNGQYADNYQYNDTATLTNLIFYPIPVPDFSINDTFQCFKGNKFVFTNTTTITSGTFTSYWDFGDGTYSSQTSPSHTYTSLANYNVKLIVTSFYGCADSITKYVYLKPNQTTDFSVSDTSLCLKGNSFSFTNKTSFGYGTFTNLWKFGDNTASTATNPTHSYNTTGTYLVKLITTTNTGCVDSITIPVHVYEHPTASFTVSDDTFACFKTNKFELNSTTSISSGSFTLLWNLGDTTTSTSSSVTKSYSSTGIYQIKLIATSDRGCKDSITRLVVVHPNPQSDFTINDSSQCKSSNNYIFTNKSQISSGTFNSFWNFGDNTTSSTYSATKSYSASGIYNVKLVTVSGFGCKDSLTKKVYVRPNPVCVFTIDDSSQCLRVNSVHFNNLSSISSGTMTYFWDFGNNTTSSQFSPIVKYNQTGTFSVKLTTVSNFGCKDSFIRNVYIRPHPVSSFKVNDSSQCLKNNSFIFTNTTSLASGTFMSLWDFGNFTTSTLTNPVYSYNSEGNFKVRLITTSDFGCTDTITKMVFVNPNPISFFNTGVKTQCLESNLYIFSNHSIVSSGTISAYLWEFGDGNTSTLANPQHKYSSDGVFKVLLTVTSDKGCVDTSSKMVEVIPQPVAVIDLTDTAQCFKNHKFFFNDNSYTTSGTITGYYWNFGDGKTSSLKNVSHSYTMVKSYKVTHIVTSSNGCTDTVYKTVYVFPMPVAAFSVSDTNQCLKGNSFSFTNNSSGSQNLSYLWDFGDLKSSSVRNPVYSYTNPGQYNVSLITYNEYNCADTAMPRSVIVRPNPVVNLGNDTTIYHNQSLLLDAGGGFDKYLWSNNDTTRSVLVDTSLIGLNNPTLFWVKVSLNGCEGSDSVVVTIIFNSSIDESKSAARLVVYPNPAENYINLAWDKFLGEIEITLYDVNGKIVKRESVGNVRQYQLNISELASGIYYLRFNDSQAVKVLKLSRPY